MNVSDDFLMKNHDWDPSYLSQLVLDDFYEFADMWMVSNVSDSEIIQESQRVECYYPITEDISMDDIELCTAVEKIKQE